MHNEYENGIANEVHDLIRRAGQAASGEQAMQFARAALSLSEALVEIKEAKRIATTSELDQSPMQGRLLAVLRDIQDRLPDDLDVLSDEQITKAEIRQGVLYMYGRPLIDDWDLYAEPPRRQLEVAVHVNALLYGYAYVHDSLFVSLADFNVEQFVEQQKASNESS
ncbi:MAG TPA: hypothetical protein DDW52_22760 [Planctomycetaceae bacterium]|nr:hypothetical protein [Planctomycetaceae bacterium]